MSFKSVFRLISTLSIAGCSSSHAGSFSSGGANNSPNHGGAAAALAGTAGLGATNRSIGGATATGGSNAPGGNATLGGASSTGGQPTAGGSTATSGSSATAGNASSPFEIAISPNPNPPIIGGNTLTITITGAASVPVVGATVNVSYLMTTMPGMGGPVTVTEKGNGEYSATNLNFSMEGPWKVTVLAKVADLSATQNVFYTLER